MLCFLLAAHAAPPPDAPIEEAIDLVYHWVNAEAERDVQGWTTAHLTWFEADGTEDRTKDCKRRWARGWCGAGTFRTEDGGTGAVELGVARDGRKRLRTVTLFYNRTGAAYYGEVRLRALGALFEGEMDLAEDPAWTGSWVEPVRSEAEPQ